MDGRKDVLGMWVGENESAKFWAGVLNSLRNRGVDDILIACTDNLTGFSQAIEAVFPKTDIQNCIIHQLRNSSKYVSYKDIKALMADLKMVYTAATEEAALDALDSFADLMSYSSSSIPMIFFFPSLIGSLFLLAIKNQPPVLLFLFYHSLLTFYRLFFRGSIYYGDRIPE